MKDRILRIALIVLAINTITLLSNGRMSKRYQRNVPEDAPYRFVNAYSGIREVTDFCVEGDFLYLLYGGAGYMKVYDLDGNYSHSFAYKASDSGMAKLYTDADVVCLESENHDVYTFSDGEFVSFYEMHSENHPGYGSDGSERTDAKGFEYRKRWASIERVGPDGTVQTVVSRPFFLVLFEGLAPFVIQFLGIGFVFYCVLSERAAAKKRTTASAE